MTILWGKVLTSKTLWTNGILLLIGIVELLQANIAGTPPLIPAKYLLAAAGILNLILRFITNDALTKK